MGSVRRQLFSYVVSHLIFIMQKSKERINKMTVHCLKLGKCFKISLKTIYHVVSSLLVREKTPASHMTNAKSMYFISEIINYTSYN